MAVTMTMTMMTTMTKLSHLFEFEPVGVIKLARPGFPRSEGGKTTPVMSIKDKINIISKPSLL